MNRSLLTGIALALTGLLASFSPGPAYAGTLPAATISNTPTMVPFATTNGDILAVADFSVDGVPEVAFGGDFSSVTTPDRVVHAATNFAVVNEATGSFVYGASGVASTGYVRAIAYGSGSGLLYVGGDFTSWGGVARRRLLALTVPGFAVSTTWNPGARARVNKIVTDPTGVFVAGVAATGVRSINPTTGAVNWSDPVPYGPVRSLAVDHSIDGLFVGGFFDSIDGFTNHGLIELNELTGAPVTTFRPVLQPNVPADGGDTGEDPVSLAIDTDVTPHQIMEGSGGKQNWIRMRTITTGAVVWDHGAPGDIQAIVEVGGSVVVGYHRVRINGPGLQWPYYTAQLSEPTGALQTWQSGLSQLPPTVTDGGVNGVRAFAFDPVTDVLVVAGAFMKYGATCNDDVTLTCTGGKPMRSLAEYQVSLTPSS